MMDALIAKHPDDSNYLFEAAQYYAKRARYDKTIDYYERSFEAETRRPRFIDALDAIADVYLIMGEYQKAADTYDRIIECQQKEWGMTEEFELKDMQKAKERVLAKIS